MSLSKKTKELFNKNYGVDLDSEELFEALYEKRRHNSKNKKDDGYKTKSADEADEDTMRMMMKWK